jgi:hypothetical protein
MAGRTLNGERFLQHDEGRDGANRIIPPATLLLCCRVCADVKMSYNIHIHRAPAFFFV